mmetsp:Transcript_84582/g.217942  ORF Transcript_84582/g.217942 Transcript_84582/m.217942 type:complete len:135 (-) Transcript_84582:48-452(-)
MVRAITALLPVAALIAARLLLFGGGVATAVHESRSHEGDLEEEASLMQVTRRSDDVQTSMHDKARYSSHADACRACRMAASEDTADCTCFVKSEIEGNPFKAFQWKCGASANGDLVGFKSCLPTVRGHGHQSPM